jgi:hypothetical protein
MTSADILHRQVQFEQSIKQLIQQAIQTQMNDFFDKISTQMPGSPASVTNEKKHQASDVSSPVKQSKAKRQDIKPTPQTKNHPIPDVTASQTHKPSEQAPIVPATNQLVLYPPHPGASNTYQSLSPTTHPFCCTPTNPPTPNAGPTICLSPL